VAPGPVATELFLTGKDDATIERLAKLNPMERLAIEAESEDSELGVFESVADAVTFSVNYLGGAALRDIDVVRRGGGKCHRPAP
jgi:hypothetical protein